MSVGMSDAQWTDLGSVIRQVHGIGLRSEISQYVRRETFIPKLNVLARELHKQVNTRNYEDPYRKELATFWKENNQTIQTLIEQAEMIGKRLQKADLEFVLCHADIHTANILITPEKKMFIVDWDETLLAPKERDLMFILDEDTIRTRAEQMFFNGYGKVKINQLAIAYYRYEWCVQEIGDFGCRVFAAEGSGENTKRAAVQEFMKLFSRGDVVEAALNGSREIDKWTQ